MVVDCWPRKRLTMERRRKRRRRRRGGGGGSDRETDAVPRDVEMTYYV